MMKKVISFSLWGNQKKYVLGAILNADIALELWPEWICRYYVAPSVPESSIKELESRKNVEVIRMEEEDSWNSLFWRYYTAEDWDVDAVIFRDTDSRIGVRDKAAVDEWLKSDKNVHIIRDHCVHGWRMMGGTWGVRNAALCEIKSFINDFELKNEDGYNRYGIDQIYLSNEIYPLIQEDAYIHDDWIDNFEWEDKHPHPIPREQCSVSKSEWTPDCEDFSFTTTQVKCEYDVCNSCGKRHDNDFLGKPEEIKKSEEQKYEHLLEDLI